MSTGSLGNLLARKTTGKCSTMRRSATLQLEPLVDIKSPATAALGGLTPLKPLVPLKPLQPLAPLKPLTPLKPLVALPPSAATAALEDLMKDSSRKRMKQSVEDTPRRSPAMISFSKTNSTKPKFDMTGLFQATTESSAGPSSSFAFPSLAWPGLDDKDEHDEADFPPPPPIRRAADPSLPKTSGVNLLQQDQEEDTLSSRSPSKDSLSRRSISASCLLGKRSRSGGLVRSKTMRSEVDRLVNHFASNEQANLMPVFSLGSTKA